MDSGALREAIHVEEVEDGALVVAGDTEAWYGRIVEFEFVRTPAQPFLIPAMESVDVGSESITSSYLSAVGGSL